MQTIKDAQLRYMEIMEKYREDLEDCFIELDRRANTLEQVKQMLMNNVDNDIIISIIDDSLLK